MQNIFISDKICCSIFYINFFFQPKSFPEWSSKKKNRLDKSNNYKTIKLQKFTVGLSRIHLIWKIKQIECIN